MSEPTWTPMHGSPPKPGDYVAVLHDCADGTIRHEAPVLVTAVYQVTLGLRIRGVRCDGSRIEWIEETDAR